MFTFSCISISASDSSSQRSKSGARKRGFFSWMVSLSHQPRWAFFTVILTCLCVDLKLTYNHTCHKIIIRIHFHSITDTIKIDRAWSYLWVYRQPKSQTELIVILSLCAMTLSFNQAKTGMKSFGLLQNNSQSHETQGLDDTRHSPLNSRTFSCIWTFIFWKRQKLVRLTYSCFTADQLHSLTMHLGDTPDLPQMNLYQHGIIFLKIITIKNNNLSISISIYIYIYLYIYIHTVYINI